MDYTISPSIEGTFIILKVKGNITRQGMMQKIFEAHAFGKQLQVRRYLVDVTEAKNTDEVIENYMFAYSDMQEAEGIDKYARVAALVSPNDHSHDFVETVVRNSGLNFSLFTELNLAERFLMYEYSPNEANAGDLG
jgi:hypothetical protein